MAFNLFTLKIHFKLKDCFAPKMKKTVIHSKLFIVFISFCVELRHFKSVKNDSKNTRYDKRINKMMSTERHLSFLRNEFTSYSLARCLIFFCGVYLAKNLSSFSQNLSNSFFCRHDLCCVQWLQTKGLCCFHYNIINLFPRLLFQHFHRVRCIEKQLNVMKYVVHDKMMIMIQLHVTWT